MNSLNIKLLILKKPHVYQGSYIKYCFTCRQTPTPGWQLCCMILMTHVTVTAALFWSVTIKTFIVHRLSRVVIKTLCFWLLLFCKSFINVNSLTVAILWVLGDTSRYFEINLALPPPLRLGTTGPWLRLTACMTIRVSPFPQNHCLWCSASMIGAVY